MNHTQAIRRVRKAARSLLAQVLADSAQRGIKAEVTTHAPHDLATLRRAARKDAIGWIVPVSDAHSEGAVFDVSGNVRFRAWHDVEHLERGLEFDVRGEWAAAEHGRTRIYGRDEGRLLAIEVGGQASYRARHGAFLEDQVSFAVHAFQFGLACAIERGGF